MLARESRPSRFAERIDDARHRFMGGVIATAPLEVLNRALPQAGSPIEFDLRPPHNFARQPHCDVVHVRDNTEKADTESTEKDGLIKKTVTSLSVKTYELRTEEAVWQTEPVSSIGDRIKAFRKARGWKQADLAQQAGLNIETVNRAENIGQPTTRTLEKLAGAFKFADVMSFLLADVPDVSSLEQTSAIPQKKIEGVTPVVTEAGEDLGSRVVSSSYATVPKGEHEGTPPTTQSDRRQSPSEAMREIAELHARIDRLLRVVADYADPPSRHDETQRTTPSTRVRRHLARGRKSG